MTYVADMFFHAPRGPRSTGDSNGAMIHERGGNAKPTSSQPERAFSP